MTIHHGLEARFLWRIEDDFLFGVRCTGDSTSHIVVLTLGEDGYLQWQSPVYSDLDAYDAAPFDSNDAQNACCLEAAFLGIVCGAGDKSKMTIPATAVQADGRTLGYELATPVKGYGGSWVEDSNGNIVSAPEGGRLEIGIFLGEGAVSETTPQAKVEISFRGRLRRFFRRAK